MITNKRTHVEIRMRHSTELTARGMVRSGLRCFAGGHADGLDAAEGEHHHGKRQHHAGYAVREPAAVCHKLPKPTG